MINYIKQKRKRMAKVQKRTYAVIPQSKRTAIYKHLKADLCSDKILSHLDAGFEKSLFLASLRGGGLRGGGCPSHDGAVLTVRQGSGG